MLKLFLSFLLTVACALNSFAQTSAILWAKCGTGGVLVPSPGTNRLLFTSLFDWESWPISNVVLPGRGVSYFDSVDGILDVAWASIATKEGHEVISACVGDRIIAWNPDSNIFTLLATLPAKFAPLSIAASASGNIIAVSFGDSSVYILDRGTDTIKASWKAFVTSSVSVSPDGKLLLAGIDSTHLALIDLKTRSVLHRYVSIYNRPGVLEFNPMRPGTFIVWDNDLKEMDTSGAILVEWPSENTGTEITFSPSGSRITSAGLSSSNGQVSADIIDLDSHSVTHLPYTDAAFLNEDTLVVSGIRLYSISRSQELGTLACTQATSGAFSLVGNLLVAGGTWDPKMGNLISATAWGGHASTVVGRQAIAGGGPNGEVYYWRSPSDSGTVFQSSISDSSAPTAVAISPTDSILASASQIYSDDGRSHDARNAVELWNTRTDTLMRLDNPLYPVFALAFSSDGSKLAASDADHYYVWNAYTGQRLTTLLRDDIRGGPGLVTFMPGDTSLLVIGDAGYEIRSILGDATITVPYAITDATVVRLPDGSFRGGFTYGNYNAFQTRNVTLFDIASGKEIGSTPIVDSGNILWMTVNHVTGDFAMGGSDLIVYRSLYASSSVASMYQATQPLQAYASTSRITVLVPGSGDLITESGKIFIYNALGECCFTRDVKPGERSITTGALSAGDYFIVFKSAGEAPGSAPTTRFTKVSLF